MTGGAVVVVSGVVGGSGGGGGSCLAWTAGAAATGAVPSTTYTGSPWATRPGKYSAMCMGMRTQPWEAGWVGTDSEPCTAMPSEVK